MLSAFLLFLLVALGVHGEERQKKKMFDLPQRDISIIVTEEGFYPEKFSLFVGEKVNFFVTSVTNSPSCFVIESKGVFLSATKGKISEGIAVFNGPGVYRFHCPSGKIEGEIVVLKKKEKKLDEGRKIASETVKIWRPREE